MIDNATVKTEWEKIWVYKISQVTHANFESTELLCNAVTVKLEKKTKFTN